MAYDTIVIGSGAGGATIASVLARAGQRVLVIERGFLPTDRTAFQDESRMLLRREAQDDRAIRVNNRLARLYVGGVPGGGTALYGGALLRPAPEDFEPGRWYRDHLPEALHRWPVTYDELEPFFQKAEDLFHVAGDGEAAMPHLGRRSGSYPGPTPALEPINHHLKTSLESQGLTPFHLPLAINFDTCLWCSTCPGYICPNVSRANAVEAALKPAIEKHGAELRTGWEVERLLTDTRPHKKAKRVRILNRRTGERLEVEGDRFIVAAGAVWSPVLLMKSGLGKTSPELGRNYMYHCGAMAVGVFPRPTGAADRFVKQLGWTDDYFGANEFPHKLGYVQTLPVPGPLTLQHEAPIHLPAPLAQRIYEHSLAFTGTVEDLPLASNRITLFRNGRVRLQHHFHPYDVQRAKYVLRRLRSLMRKSGALFVVGATGDKDDIHTAHQVGTCRFGEDPNTSVLDRWCRVHDSDNVYVVDGSFMPTSLGVGPALTIIANALRVGSHLS